MEYTVIFQPSGCRGTVLGGTSLLEAGRKLGVDIEAPCGSSGICGKCKVKIEKGFSGSMGITSESLSPLSDKEKKLLSAQEIADGYRLACSAKVQGDILVYIPEESRVLKQVILENGQTKAFILKPALTEYCLALKKPSLDDYRDDFTRVKDAVGIDKLTIDYRLLTVLPDILRKNKWRVKVIVWESSEIIAVRPESQAALYGIAVDVGTTTLAAYLCNLLSGEVIAQDSLVNSQVRYGDDVMSRITFCMMNPDGLARLNRIIVDDINLLVKRLTAAAGLTQESVLDVVVAGNTVMHHLVLNINPEAIGSAPFAAAIRQAVDIKARDLGIQAAEGAYVHSLPIEAGFVGADNVAVLIAEEPYKQDEMLLVIDIGTNGEINFGNKEGIFSASCATGPALEGAQIKFGMRAAPGAIEKIKIDSKSKEPHVKVIGNVKAQGICGSGIIDAVAELFKSGVIGRDGTFNKKISSPRVRKGEDGKYEYVLVWADEAASGRDISITQKDVRAVQLAKAALYAGAKILMQKKSVTKVERVILAGAFGSFIDRENAMVIGMFPDCDLKCVEVVGNAAGEGAKLALMNTDKRREAQSVAEKVVFVETVTESEFQTSFYDAMFLPHAKDAFPHIEHILKEIPH